MSGAVFACSIPSTYDASDADMQLVNSLYPQIDALFAADHNRGNQIMMKIKDISMNFDIESREYFILRDLHMYMNGIIANDFTIPSFISSWGELSPYMYYSSMAFDAAVEAGYEVVLNFRASRCPRCKTTSEEIISHLGEIPENVIVLEADFDSTKTLQAQYDVTIQTTFVFFDDQGMMTKKVEKLMGIDQLLEELE